ncbi:PAS domain S-box protein [Limnovirga soli]|uniref:PAS domain S-box protein n=1 Tax=Limnovirga soli TaxID=2656915 RepID=A0A8J8FE15_9BACT|nr:PAS domain S-box protein [Limnovirga soli]NNV54226.1 PAS domain S-box protein [Limnovirga soli]
MKNELKFNIEQFNRLYPFYILLNENLELERMGKSLEKLMPGIRNEPFINHFTIIRPLISEINFGILQSLVAQLLVLQANNGNKISIRGQIEYIEETKQLLIIGSPWFSTMEQLLENNLSIHDFSYSDPLIDLLHVLKNQEINSSELKELLFTVNIQKNELKKVNNEIKQLALFPLQDPDPILRVNADGEIIESNPASDSLDYFIYEGVKYTKAAFWKKIILQTGTEANLNGLEASVNGKTYLFVIKFISSENYFNIYGRDITQQKKAEFELKRISLVASANKNGVIFIDKHGTIRYANESYIRQTGFSSDEILGKNIINFCDATNKEPSVAELFLNQLSSDSNFELELIHRKKDGSNFWARVNTQIIVKDNEIDNEFFSIIEDISAEKEAIQKTVEYNNRFRIALEKIGDNVWEHDFKTGETYFSNTIEQLLGYSYTEFRNNIDLWWSSVHKDDRWMLEESDLKYKACKQDHHKMEYRMIHKNGSISWILDRGVVIEKSSSGEPLKIIGTHTDITSQKKIQEELVTTANRLSNLIYSLQDGLLVEDEKRTVVLTNNTFCKMFEIPASAESLVGMDCVAAIRHSKILFKDADFFEQTINKLVSEKQIASNLHFELKSGKVYELDYVPIFIEKRYRGHLWKYSDVSQKMIGERKLEIQRKFYEDVLNSIPADIAVFNEKHEYLFVNPVAISSPEIRKWIVGKRDEEFCIERNKPMKVAEERRALFNSVKEAGVQKEWEEMLIGKDGKPQYHLRKMYPIFDEFKQLKMMIGYGVNITDRKLIEEKISLSEKRYRDLFNFSQALICTHDLNGILLTVNPAICKSLGYSEGEMLGKNICDFMPDADKVQFKEHYLDAFDKSDSVNGVFSVLNKSGHTLYLLFQNYKVKEPDILPYIIGFSQDITERKKVEEVIKSGEEKYRSIIENMNLGMVELDNDSTIIFANENLCKMSGFNMDELLGKKLYNVFAGGQSRRFIRQKMYLKSGELSELYEFVTKNKRGEPRWWLVSVAPILASNGEVKGSIGICLDITQQKELEQDLRNAKQMAEQSSKAKEVFLANMSHEIRTPMNAILGLGRQMEKSVLDGQQRFYLSSINNAASNLLVIINDILDFSKIEAGKFNLEKIGFTLSDVIDKAFQIVSNKAEEKGLDLSIQLDSNIAPILLGDPHRINQILINLLGNSVKFTDHGSIGIRCTVLKNTTTDQLIEIVVTDTGIGMSEDFQKRLFNKFMQENDDNQNKYSGTGLGMSIAKELIELMNGQIKVFSKKDEGTVISINIPFQKGVSTDVPKKGENKINPKSLFNKHILLVEDNEMNRIVATIVLKQHGAIVDEAINGQEALDAFKNDRYDIVLMDMRMPVMDGIEATRRIRKEISATIPIIALTANAIEGEQQKCLEVGMNDFLSKPFDEDILVQTIAKWLGIKNTTITMENLESTPLQEPLYSLENLKSISRGNKDFIAKMLNIFIKEAKLALQEIKNGQQNGDFDKIKSTAHKIKPSLGNLSVTSVKEDILLLEKYDLSANTQDQFNAIIQKLDDILSKIIIDLEKQLEDNSF